MSAGSSERWSIECIYCRENKPTSSYTKVDHVLPQSFVKFENNFTLIRLVCDACNQFFGDNVELALARDTLEGQSRVEFGVKRAEEFVSPGRRSRIRITRANHPFADHLQYHDHLWTWTPQVQGLAGLGRMTGIKKTVFCIGPLQGIPHADHRFRI